MSNTLDTIMVVGEHKHLNLREVQENGRFKRRVLTPDEDLSGEVQEIKDKAEELWTDEVKAAWATFQTEQEANNPKE